MHVSRSGNYSWKNHSKSKRDQEREFLIPKVKELHKISRGTYGKRRMAVALEGATGIPCGLHKAGTLMKLSGVQVKRRKKFKATTNSSHDFQNMLKQYQIKSSMSRKGDCWDNAVAESFFGTLKTEGSRGRLYNP